MSRPMASRGQTPGDRRGTRLDVRLTRCGKPWRISRESATALLRGSAMPSPFPGMDPYLERSRWFRGLHNSLIFCLQEALQPLLPAPYFALSGEQIWMEGSERYVDPDVDVLRRVPSGPREAAESGVATLVAEAEDEPIVVTVSQSPDEER